MNQKIEASAICETCDVQDSKTGAKGVAHRVVATLADGSMEMTVFIGGESGLRSAEYARGRYTQFKGFIMHCDPLDLTAGAGAAALRAGALNGGS